MAFIYILVVFGVRAYGPGEFKILTSEDGGNFEEAACWKAAARPEVSYEETVLFDSPTDVKALTVVMRSPMPWSYFGISDVALLVEPAFPSMLVGSAASTGGEEMCVVASGSAVVMAPCLGAIAAGDGAEIFQFTNGALQNAATKRCLTLANGDAVAGKLVMSTCPEEAGDGRGIFELTSNGQLKLGVGDYCLVASGQVLSVRDCAAAASDTGSKFFQAGVGSFDPSAASVVRDGAAMLKAAAERQSGLLAKLQEALPKLSGCRLALVAQRDFSRLAALVARRDTSKVLAAGPAADAIAEIYQAFGIDRESVAAVISTSASALSKAAAA